MSLGTGEGFKEYAQKWRDLAGRVQPPLTDRHTTRRSSFDRPMPQVMEIFPKLVGLLRDSLNLDWTAPDDGPRSCLPLGWECFCSSDILRANFFVVRTKSHVQTMLFRNAKLMSVLKILKMHFLVKTSEFFVNCDVNSLFYRKP